MITIFNLDEASISIKLAISSESVCDLILENQLSYHIWYHRAPFFEDYRCCEWSKKGAHGNYFHEMTLNALFTIHELTCGVSINFW